MSKVTIRKDACKGCEICVSVCPRKCLALNKGELNNKGYHPASLIDYDACTSCAMCAIMCPDVAIKVERESKAG